MLVSCNRIDVIVAVNKVDFDWSGWLVKGLFTVSSSDGRGGQALLVVVCIKKRPRLVWDAAIFLVKGVCFSPNCLV